MKTILDYNKEIYCAEEENSYILRKYHQIRINIVFNLIKKEIHSKGKNIKMLSLACATGIFEERVIEELGINVHGIDGTKESIEQAIKRGIMTKIGDVSKKLPYNDQTFDIVYAGEIIEHLIDTRFFLQEVNRILKPQGVFVLTTPNLATFPDRIRFLSGKTPRQIQPMHPYLFLHIRPFTFQSLRDSLERTGFSIEEIKSNYVYLWNSEIAKSRTLAKLFPTLGGTLIVKARKTK